MIERLLTTPLPMAERPTCQESAGVQLDFLRALLQGSTPNLPAESLDTACVASLPGQTSCEAPPSWVPLPFISETAVMKVVTISQQEIAVEAPWRLLASWLLSQSIRSGDQAVPGIAHGVNGMQSAHFSTALPSASGMAAEGAAGRPGLVAEGSALVPASHAGCSAARNKVHEAGIATMKSVVASQAWQARLVQLLEHATHPETRARVRDFRLSESDMQALVSELRGFFAANDKPLASVWINGRSIWSKR